MPGGLIVRRVIMGVSRLFSGLVAVHAVMRGVLACRYCHPVALILRAMPHGYGRHAPQGEGGQRKNQK